jgi:hypothetical protein
VVYGATNGTRLTYVSATASSWRTSSMRFSRPVTLGLAKESTASHETGPHCSPEFQLPDKSAHPSRRSYQRSRRDPISTLWQHNGQTPVPQEVFFSRIPSCFTGHDQTIKDRTACPCRPLLATHELLVGAGRYDFVSYGPRTTLLEMLTILS